MKIYIATDLEGATGVYKFDQTRGKGPEYEEAVRLLMQDIAAVAKGLQKAGARVIMVSDGHGGGNNFIPKYMIKGVQYITGTHRGRASYGLDESFDGYIQIGYHAKNGTSDGVLHHTQSSTSESKYWYDGVERGELYQGSVIAGHFDVPVMMCTGDEATCAEARDLHGENLTTVAVKKGISREAAILLSEEDTQEKLYEGAVQAMQKLPHVKPYKVKFPIPLRIRRKRTEPVSSGQDHIYYVEDHRIVEHALDIIRGTRSV